jgi:hypothetical protein
MTLVWLAAKAFQNCATAVCSGVRTVLVAVPEALISSKSRV